MTDKPQYNLNPDGTYMNLEQIVEDVVANRLDQKTKDVIIEGGDDYKLMRHFGFGMWLRNSYGLWAEDHPHRALWEAEREKHVIDGCDHSPHHPDNYSSKVIDAIEQRLRKEQDRKKQLADNLKF